MGPKVSKVKTTFFYFRIKTLDGLQGSKTTLDDSQCAVKIKWASNSHNEMMGLKSPLNRLWAIKLGSR